MVGLLAFRLAYEQPLAESGGRVARAKLRVRKDASSWLWLRRARAVELAGTRAWRIESYRTYMAWPASCISRAIQVLVDEKFTASGL